MSDWVLAYEGFDPQAEPLREALCTLGNGFFATRGAAPETGPGGPHYPATYVNGLYDRQATPVADREIVNEDLVNLPDWTSLRFRIEDGPWFRPDAFELDGYRQELDLRRGVLTRQFSFEDGEGRRTRVTQRRLVHMADPHLAGLETAFLAENWSGRIRVRSALDGDVENAGVPRYADLERRHLRTVERRAPAEDTVSLLVETLQSRVYVAMAARTRVFANGETADVERRLLDDDRSVAHDLDLRLEEGEVVAVDKIVTLFTSRDQGISEPLLEAETWAARTGRFDDLLGSHLMAWDHLWRRFALETEDGPIQLVLNLHIFHLLQTVSKHTIDLDVGVPARGLHGEAYRGHVFWDELFILPFLDLHTPDITKALLLYRYRRLPEARANARREGLAGALYPWQSGSNGREESQVLHLNPKSGRWIEDNSRLQRHVNLAIAHSVWQHVQATGDLDFLGFYGAEMLIEISRMLAGLTSYDRIEDRYEILGVMGPDEYHDAYPDAEAPGLDNNTYTNVMTAWVLRRTLDALDLVPDYRLRELGQKLGLGHEELERWREIAGKLKVCWHEGVLSQFEGYEDLEEFDWVGYQERYGDIQRLDRILEAEGDTPNRYKLSKQADVLMLFYLLTDEELADLFDGLGHRFDAEVKRRTIEYYAARTSHGSTLSRIVHAWVHARHDPDRAWDHFRTALMSDVADIQGGTTPEGVHLGAMAGTVDLVQRGFTGISMRDDVLWFDPVLPAEIGRLTCRIRYRGLWMGLEVTGSRIVVQADAGPGVPVRVGAWGRAVEIEPGHTVELPV